MTYEHDGESLLVENMRAEVDGHDLFPVLVGNEIAHFHDVTGGYNSSRGKHVVTLTHKVQGPGSPNNVTYNTPVEVHLDSYFYFPVTGVRKTDTYPEEDYTVSLLVDEYMYGNYSFSEELTADIDRRETRYE